MVSKTILACQRSRAQTETWQPFALSFSFSLFLDLSFPPFLYPSELTLLRALSLSLYLTCGLANKNKTQNARRRGGAEAGRGCEWVVCVRVRGLDILSRPGGGQFLRWPWSLAVGRFAAFGGFCGFQRSFFPSPDDVSFRFTTVPIEFFVPFEGIEFEQRI